MMFKILRRSAARVSQVIVLVYSNGKKFEGQQGLTFEGKKRAIQIKRGISYDMLKKIIGARLKLESHQIISSLTHRFPTSQSTYTDLEILDSEDVECMICAAEKHSDVKVLELYVEIGVVGGSSSIPTHIILPTKTFDTPSNADSNYDEDRSSKDEDGGGVPNDESSDAEVAGDFNANSNVELGSSSIVAASPFASSVHVRESPQQADEDSSSPPPSASIAQPQSWTYHAFLSFRGETRRGFTDHLCASLERKGVVTYKDDKNLGGGEMISTELIKAIEESMMAIIVLSENYASSTWCLDELQKIVECKHNLGQFVVPIFYHVEPYEVRHQRGSFEEAFTKHEGRFGKKSEKVLRWRNALREVTSYSGFDSRDQLEANFVDRIAEYIYKQVKKKLPSCTENLASRVEEMIRLIDIGLKDVRFAYLGHVQHKPKANFVDSIAEYIHKQVMKRLPSCTRNLASRMEELIRLIDIELKMFALPI